MSRTLHEVPSENTSLNGSVRPMMVYMCECGEKWTNSLISSWDCKCGRQLVKRNGIIYAAIAQRNEQTAGAPRIVRRAAG